MSAGTVVFVTVLASFLRVVRAVPRSVMLGFGTIFQPKARNDDHWSVSHKVEIVEDVGSERSGDPPVRMPGRLPNVL